MAGRLEPSRGSVPLFRMRGIPVEAHWSLPISLLLTMAGLAFTLFPTRYLELGGRAYTLMAVVSTVLYLGSILLHELGHATQDIREGARPGHITLWFFGGIAWGGQPGSPAADGRITLAGPAVSALLAPAFGALAWLTNEAGFSDAVVGVPLLLAQINAILLALNLLPIFPLDGGRLLRAWLWQRRRNRLSATFSAARVGQIVAGATIAFGGLAPFTGVLAHAYKPDAAISGLGVMLFGVLGLYLALKAEDLAEWL